MSKARSARRGASALLCAAIAVLLTSQTARAANCTAPGCTIAEINLWSDEVIELIRGPIDIAIPAAGNVTFGNPLDIPGVASGIATEAVSLGDGGSVTVKFTDTIYDGPDFDFAVFENGISSGAPDLLYVELGYVEVSSDDIHYARFDSLTSRGSAVDTLEEADPDDYHNLAGNRPLGTGTEFDLFDLTNHPLVLSGDVDLDAILYVRIVDVIGNGTTFDAMSNQIWDPYNTPFITSGFDIDAVGAINVPEPGGALGMLVCSGSLLVLERRRKRAHSRRTNRTQ